MLFFLSFLLACAGAALINLFGSKIYGEMNRADHVGAWMVAFGVVGITSSLALFAARHLP